MTAPSDQPQTTIDDVLAREDDDRRRWWVRVYKAGIKADLEKQSRKPPAELTKDQKDVWLAGYDR